MKRYTLFLLLFCALTLAGTAANAQDNRSHDRRENVEAAKIAFLTEKMELTAEQSQKFWPIYNEYEAKRRELMKSYRHGYRKDVETLSEQEAKARIDEMFNTREKELALEKEYASKYQRVLSNRQLINLYRGERQFTKMLLKRLDHDHKKMNQ
ncbi:Spy/CpxP family protein refolding chaperone [Pontibacter toksunensis]|uniref:Spy/CpxP family protein refolding chaperone n=2 Tax=Pontibacter toksunensis TaxID=1332631 RepID=A0ABW6C1P6_9BACT